MNYRIVIPTAGIGSRLQNLTKHLNKSLVSLSNRPILSHIIDQFPKTSEFVVALGYKGELVKQFLELAYPKRIFYYVNVKTYKGNGSGLGHTLLCCKKYLKQPFIFISCDTLVKEKIPELNFDWMGYSLIKNLNDYRTLKIKKKRIIKINEKKNYPSKDSKAYIGLAGISNYSLFWKRMQEGKKKAIQEGEVYGIKNLLKTRFVKPIKFTWYDTGNQKSLIKASRAYKEINEPNILRKENEDIWFINDIVIKFSTDLLFIKNRFNRAKKLKGFVPNILSLKKNMYSYKKTEGNVFSDIVTKSLFKSLLKNCNNFWKKKKLTNKEKIFFKIKCDNFYYKKTLERINLFYKKFNKKDGIESINGESMPKLSKLLTKINWEDLTTGCPGRFHGDFHFENIIYNSKKQKFTFLDWRQDFAGNLDVGDIYYDLAKLLHGIIVSHETIVKNHFFVKWEKKEIKIKIKRKKILRDCENIFNKWCKQNNFSINKIRILTALIFINISPLHHYPYSLFLFSLGKQMLNKYLSPIKN